MMEAELLSPSPTFATSRTERDEVLVEAARAGSLDAFSELFGHYSNRLYRRAYRITRNREDAEDVVQEAFLRAYSNLHQFEGRSMFSSWLMRIAINTALMTLRRRRTRQESSLVLSVEANGTEEVKMYEPRDNRPGPEEIHLYRQEYQHMLRSIRRLPTIMRKVAEKRMLCEQSIEELTCEFGISESAVKARLFRARVRLHAARA